MEPDDRLTDLERTQRFHEQVLVRHDEQIRRLIDIQESQARNLTVLTQNLTVLTDVSARLDATLQAIRDILRRGNGH